MNEWVNFMGEFSKVELTGGCVEISLAGRGIAYEVRKEIMELAMGIMVGLPFYKVNGEERSFSIKVLVLDGEVKFNKGAREDHYPCCWVSQEIREGVSIVDQIETHLRKMAEEWRKETTGK